MATDATSVPGLRLLPAAEDQPPAGRTLPVMLSAAPFRPGELPTIVWLPAAPDTRDAIRAGASQAGVPAELWLRIAVEAARLREEVARSTGHGEEWVESTLDDAAMGAGEEPVPSLVQGALVRYAAQLQRSHPCGGVAPTLPVRLPEELLGAWSRRASELRLSLSQWVAMQVGGAPERCVAWEIAAARASESLAAWGYASSLRALASSIA